MPNTSPQRKIIKSKEYLEESESSSEIEEYNILSRPKRNIILNNVTNNQFDQSDDDDEDDEDFKDFSMSSRSSSSDDASDNDNNETKSINEETIAQSVDLNKKTIVKKEAKIKKVKTEAKTSAATKTKRTTLIKKNKLKKILNQKKLDSNKEIDKMLSTFKNVNKKQISKNKQRISNGYIGDMEHSNTHIYTGPFVKQNKHKNYSTYIVVGSQLPETEQSNENVAKTTELLIPREKMNSIKDSSVEYWTCSLCHGRPNSLEGLGPLFGPYRLNQPDDSEEKGLKFKIYKIIF